MTRHDWRGFTEPRIATDLIGYRGDRVDQIDQLLLTYFGERLDPWERIYLKHLSAYGDDERWLLKIALLLVARQNGKSHSVMGRILDDMKRGKRVVACAQNLDVASQTWNRVADLYDSRENGPLAKYCKKVNRTLGGRIIECRNGGIYRLVAANHKAGRGLFHIDTLWMDEVREQRDWRAYDALQPLTTVSDDPQEIYTTNAGDVGSVVLNALQEQGHAVIAGTNPDTSLGLLEWSAPPGSHMDDREAWAYANPNAGHRYPWDVLERAFHRAPANPSGWRTERMCMPADALGAKIDGMAWARLEDQSKTTIGGPCYMSYEIDHLRRSATVHLGYDIDGEAHVKTVSVFTADLDQGQQVSDRQVADAVASIAKQVKPKRIGYLEGTGGAVAGMLQRVRPRLPLWNMQGQQSARACQLLDDKVRTGRGLSHDGNETTALHIGTAVPEETRNGGWWFSRVRSPGPINAATGTAIVTYLTLTPTRRGAAATRSK